ncbi:MAG TPA: glutamine-hydrolyzing GMP synthase [Terrimicrobiaceae bacterium]|nr:glutamine-hydrolyzing GMP synthase [Terrimicrobiaceae bacterium]
MPEHAFSSEDKIVILDFGSQYTQVIARRVRECRVYSEILPFWTKCSALRESAPKGIILSGGPASVYAPKAPRLDPDIYRLGVPVLGICYGLQLLAFDLGGAVERSAQREYGPGKLRVDRRSDLFHGLPAQLDVWNSHGDRITKLPKGFRALGKTENSPNAVIGDTKRRIYGLQFHPEVAHTPRGKAILENFVHRICGCRSQWTMGSFIERTCAQIRNDVADSRVILGLSGGVDSSVAAALLHRAVGDQLSCIFVDNGLLRAREAEAVEKLFGGHFHIRLRTIDASKRFLRRLKGVVDPERKRKIIGNEFIKVFEAAARALRKTSPGRYRFLAQGTLYPDVIESVSISGNPAALIKSHHNVGGLPERMKFKLVEPLRQLFKDEVREVGLELGLPKEIVHRQPFPGPGLAVRILGEITPEKLRVVREADAIVLEEMKASGWYYKVWQSFAVLLPVQSVGVMGDERTYENTIALRIVESRDGMTADWVRIPFDLLGRISTRVINEVRGVNRVCYDVSSKPPATIEWE